MTWNQWSRKNDSEWMTIDESKSGWFSRRNNYFYWGGWTYNVLGFTQNTKLSKILKY